MLKTVPLSQWMPSIWATMETAGDSVKKRLSLWPKEVTDVAQGEFDVSGDINTIRMDEKAYHQNAAVIAFLLLERIMNELSTSSMGNSRNNINVDPNSIKVTFRTEEEGRWCSLDSVSAVLQPSTDKHRSLFYSLGETLLILFNQHDITPECRAALLSRQVSLNEEGECCADTFDSFQDTMQRALAILDFEEGGESSTLDDYEWPQGKRGRTTMTPSSLSTICTTFPTLPMSICRLIADVMEGSDGGYATSKTSFTSLAEVVDDLKRMILDPDIFLHNPSYPMIDFGARLHGREKEISNILSIANSISSTNGSGTLEIISVHGYSGSGKTFLVNHVGRHLSTKGWIFLQGKFDRMRQNDAALSVMISAFENFFVAIESMRCSEDSDDLTYCDQVATNIKELLGPDEVVSLSLIIPSIKKLVRNELINTDGDGSDGANQIVRTGEESAMYQQRLEYLLFVFVDAILSVGRPILLLYDDTQWAGMEGCRFLQKLLKHIADQTTLRKHLLFIECCGNKEEEGVEIISSMISSHDSVHISRIGIGEFSKLALNEIISYALHLPPRITSPLSEVIHVKTTGNIMFLIEFMKSLEKSKMLTYNLSERQWTWDIDIVPLQRISGGVVGLLMSKLLDLNKNVLNCLVMASCFGSQVNLSIMELLDGLRGVSNIGLNLDRASEEGILDKAGPLYMFSHNSLQQTAYEITPKNERNQLHLEIGSTLISRSASAPKEVIEELFSAALSHINRAIPNYDNGSSDEINLSPSQRVVFAKLNLKAAQKAINSSADFALARFHLNAGMAFLSENCWYDQYTLTLNLHTEYADVLLVQHDYEELDSHSKIILRNTRCIEDQIRVHEVLIASLFRSGEFMKALDYVRSVLDTLGFPLPPSVDAVTVRNVLETMRYTASSFTPEHMSAFPLMADEVIKQAMKIMGSVPIILTFSSPTFSGMIACQMIQLTIQHGLCAESAVAFANLGYAINCVLMDFNCGYAMGNLALAIFERFKSNTLILKTHALIFGFIKAWKEPLQSCSEGLRYAIHQGSLAGDGGSVLMTKTILHRQMMIYGCKLSELRISQERLCRELMYNKGENKFGAFFFQTLGDLYMILSFTGESDDKVASIFMSREECEQSLLERYLSTKNTSLLQLFHYHRFLQCFGSKDFETALDHAEEYFKLGSGNIWRMTDIATAFLSGLVAFGLARNTNKDGLMETGEKKLLTMQDWADNGSKWNAENKALLLQAERHYNLGNLDEAKSTYEASIKSAREHKFIHEEALAYELYGNFCVKTGDAVFGHELLRKAQSLYVEWGAMVRAADVFPVR